MSSRISEPDCAFTLCDCCGHTVSVELSHTVIRAGDDKECYLCFKCFDEIIWSAEQKDGT